MTRTQYVSVVLAVALGLAQAPQGAESPGAAERDAGGEALAAELEVEGTQLEADRSRRDSLARVRVELTQKLERVQRALDETLRKGDGADPLQIRQHLDELRRADAERGAVLSEEHVVVDRIAERLERMQLLAEQLEVRKASRVQEVAGTLTGTWDLSLMPIEHRGTCVLEQHGAMVSGTYQLEGGFSGSLQGTLINRKVFLVRIDSKLGKSMEFEGYLSSDGQQIRGSWLNYELAGSDGSTGQWSARRRSAGPP